MKTVIGTLTRLGFILAVACLTVPSQASPAPGKNADFSGKWKLNESKSEMGGGGFGIGKMLDITQQGNTMTIQRTMTTRNGEERTMTGKYNLDGKESDNSMGARTSKSVLSWSNEGKTLTIDTKSTFNRDGQNFESKSLEVWTLSEDGKTLYIDLTVNSSRGKRHSTLVYDKQ